MQLLQQDLLNGFQDFGKLVVVDGKAVGDLLGYQHLELLLKVADSFLAGLLGHVPPEVLDFGDFVAVDGFGVVREQTAEQNSVDLLIEVFFGLH